MSRLVSEGRSVLIMGSSTTAPGGTGPTDEAHRYTNLIAAARPQDTFEFSGVGGTLVSYWVIDALSQGNAAANNYVIISDADAANFAVGQYIQLYTSANVLKESTIFTITAKPSSGGFTNLTFTPNAAAIPASDDRVKKAFSLTPKDVAIVQLGINDWYAPVNEASFKTQVRDLFMRLRQQSPKIELFWLRAWMPNSEDASRIQTWNDYEVALREVVEMPGVRPATFLDMRETNRAMYWYDATGFHYNNLGHQLLAKKVLEYL